MNSPVFSIIGKKRQDLFWDQTGNLRFWNKFSNSFRKKFRIRLNSFLKKEILPASMRIFQHVIQQIQR
ncbi:hypothetical protein LEP1GSC192_1288 [Leptospira sp. B5-022]|nr:hypothetical protein LEP1GSC192_1288 [Leptospira sp. B5-022]